MFLESAADLHRGLHRRFRTRVKFQRHPVAGWDPSQTARSFGLLKLHGRANNPLQFLNRRVLVANRKLRVANDVDEQDMGDFELDLFLDLGGHVHFGAVSASFWKRGSLRSGSNIGSSRSNAGVSGIFNVQAPAPGIESTFSNVAMARSDSPVCAATRARTSIELGPSMAFFSIGHAAIARSARAKAAVFSPMLMLVSARSPIRAKLSGCSFRKGSISLRACLQLFCAAPWSPARSCAHPSQKRSSPLR